MPESRYWDCREACWVDWAPQVRQVEAVVPAQAQPVEDPGTPTSGPLIPTQLGEQLAPSQDG